MHQETINMRLYRDYYDVDVTFEFINTGETETISLGFPVEVYTQSLPDYKKEALLVDFHSYINDKLLDEYTIMEEVTGHDDREYGYVTYTKWYIREVVFPANSTTISRVAYRTPYGHSSFSKTGGYIFGTGYNWKGTIGKMTVNVTHNDDLFIEDFSFGRYSSEAVLDSYTSTGSGIHRFEFNNVETEFQDRIRFGIVKCNMLNTTLNEFRGTPFDGWMWSNDLLQRDRQINLYTKPQIRLFINYFYAIYGYNFRDRNYFNFFTGLSYVTDKIVNGKYVFVEYKVNPDFSEEIFNKIERKNIDYLLTLERRIP
jgi:hypothetical protein